MKKTIALASLLGAIACALPAHAQFAKPEDAIKYRKAGFTLTAAHFGRLGAMAQGKASFDAKAAAESAEVLAVVSKLPFTAFVEGSDKGETRAKPEIWKESAKFKEAADKNMAEVAKLADLWMHPKQGTDAAVAMAMGHVILKEFYFEKRSSYFDDYVRRGL